MVLVIPYHSHISDFNGTKTTDTFELTSINGIPIVVSEEWRKTPDGSKSIADWVFETNKPLTPICYFKAHSQISGFRISIILVVLRYPQTVFDKLVACGSLIMRCFRISKGNKSYCFRSKCRNIDSCFYSNHVASSISAS